MYTIPEKLIALEIKKLVPVLGKQNAERLYRSYLLADEETRIRIAELLDVLKASVLSNPELKDTVLMEPPSKTVATQGDIEVGSVLYGKKELYPFKLNKKAFLTHIGVFGSSGYGKTNISYWLIEKLAEQNVPVLIFDFSKRNYKDLLKTKLKDKIDIYTVGRNVAPFRFNPLKPPEGVLLSQWIKEFATIFDHAYWLLGGGRHIILKSLSDVYDQTRNPRLPDLKEWIYSYKGGDAMSSRERNWLATAERPLESLCFKEVGETFDTDEGLLPSEFLQQGKITILELDALDTSDKTFFIEIILQWLRDWLLLQKDREVLKGCVIMEEAHHMLNRDKSLKLGSETIIDLVFREIRELGLGMIYIDQHPSLVSYPALGNTSTHIYMNLGLDTKHSSDILDASHMLGLDYEEQGNYLRRLPIGQGFMLVRTLSFTEPFLVKFHHVDIEKGSVSDDDIIAHMKARRSDIYDPVEKKKTKKEKVKEAYDAVEERTRENARFKVQEIQEDAWETAKKPLYDPKKEIHVPEKSVEQQEQERKNDKKIWAEKHDTTQHADVDKYGYRIIESLGKGAGAFASEIYKKISVSGTVFNEKVAELMDQGLVGLRTAKIHRNRLYYYYLTDKGKEFFDAHIKADLPEPQPIDVKRIVEVFEFNGWRAKQDNNRLYLEGDGKRIPVRLIETYDREEISKQVRGYGSFLVSDDTAKNILLQEVAKFAAEEDKEVTVFVQIGNRFEVKGGFEKVSFEKEVPKKT